MNKTFIANALVILFFCTNFLFSYTGLFGPKWVPTIIIWCETILTICGILTSITEFRTFAKNKEILLFVFIYIVYNIFVFCDIYIYSEFPRNTMLGVPKDDFSLIQNFSLCTFPMILAPSICKRVDCVLIAKLMVIASVLFLPIYFSRVNYVFYLEYGSKELTPGEFVELGILDPFGIAQYCSWGFLGNIYIKDKDYWLKNRRWNNVIFWIFAIVTLVGVLIASKRGPLLFLVITVLWYYFVKEKVRLRSVLYIAILIIVLNFFGQYLLRLISEIFPGIVDRIFYTADDGGSGRFGDDDSLYSLAWEQIKSNPWFGTNFRLVDMKQKGMYPHNFILETLMTFGIFFSIILYKLVYNVFRKGFMLIKNNDGFSIFVLLFIYNQLFMLTSSTLFLRTNYWIPFFLVLMYSVYKKEEYKNE